MASIRDPSDGQRGNRIGELEGESDKMSKIQNRVGPVTSIFSQAKLDPVVSALKVGIYPKARKFANPKGPEERLNKMRKTVTALIKYERIELNFHRAHEARAYAERLISDAIRHGDTHEETMEMADYWLVDKALVHKLFKVLVPRFENYDISYTKMFKAPRNYPGSHYERTIMELRGNPFPDLIENRSNNRFLIHNVLLDAAKQEFRQQKYAEIAQNMVAEENIVPKEVDPTLIS